MILSEGVLIRRKNVKKLLCINHHLKGLSFDTITTFWGSGQDFVSNRKKSWKRIIYSHKVFIVLIEKKIKIQE